MPVSKTLLDNDNVLGNAEFLFFVQKGMVCSRQGCEESREEKKKLALKESGCLGLVRKGGW